MTVSDLLGELEPLTHDARMRRMVAIGRAAGTDLTVAATLDVLEKGDFYQRLLALQASYGSHHAGRVMRALSDPSRILRGRALKLVACFGTDEHVCKSLLAAGDDLRLGLLRRLHRYGRLSAIDGFLDDLAPLDPAALSVILPFGSAAVVVRHHAIARPLGGEVFWKRLARLHPAHAVEVVRAALIAGEVPDARSIREAEMVLTAVADRHPDLGVALALCMATIIPLSRFRSGLLKLLQHRPDDVADLLLASTDDFHLSFDSVARRLNLERLRVLLERRPTLLTQPEVWFRHLPPQARADLFATFSQRWHDTDGCTRPALVARLPAMQRCNEALRNLSLPALATRPPQRLPFAALLPFDEARATLDPWLNHPEGELRALALQTLAGAVRYERSRLADLLELVRARRNEQDPVRCGMLAGLADLPPSVWHAAHLETLGQILRDALSAADLSAATAGHGERLVVALLRCHPGWAAEWLKTLVEERGRIHLGNLSDRLNDSDVRRLAPVLLPVLHSWRNRERQSQLAGFAQSLGRRLRAFEGLPELLEHEVEVTRTQWSAEYTLALLAQHCRTRLAALIPRLVAADPSWATRLTVYAYLHRRRQDLLTPFLGQRAYAGRFSTGLTRFVLPLGSGFFRWTPAQQATFQKTLREVADAATGARDLPSLLQVVSQLAALPAVDIAPLARLATDERAAVQEGTLRALGRLDAGQGVPILLEALDDQRARIAIYALRSAVLAMPSDQAVALLRGVKSRKITVAKECIRLLGEVGTEEAFGELLRLDGETLHRDVRIALLRALWDHLERPLAWKVLDRAADSPDPALMNSVVRIPADRLSDNPRQRLLAVLLRLLNHSDPAVRVQVLQRLVSLPVDDPNGLLLPALVRPLSSALPDERQAAAQAILAVCRATDAGLVGKAFAELLPRRRALLSSVGALRSAVGYDRRRLVPIARAVLVALANDGMTAHLRATLAVDALPRGELTDVLIQMCATDELGPDVLVACASGLNGWAGRTDARELETLEEDLAGMRDERLRRIALVALIAQASRAGGWSEVRLNRLCRFRQDPSPLVAAWAQFTLPAEEVDGEG